MLIQPETGYLLLILAKVKVQPLESFVPTPVLEPNSQLPLLSKALSLWLEMGHPPSTAGTFQKKFQTFRNKFRKDPGNALRAFPGIPLESTAGIPPLIQGLRLPEHFQNYLPLTTAGDASFFRDWFWRGPLRAAHGIASSTEGLSGLKNTAYLTLFPGFLRTRSLGHCFLQLCSFRAKGRVCHYNGSYLCTLCKTVAACLKELQKTFIRKRQFVHKLFVHNFRAP